MASEPAVDHGAAGERQHDTRIGGLELPDWRSALGRRLAGLAQRSGDAVGPHTTLLITLAIGAAIAFGLCLIAAAVYDAVTDRDGIAGIDRPVLDAIIAIRTTGTDAGITAFTDLAGMFGMPVIAVVALLILSVRRGTWTPVVLIVAAGAGSLLMTVAGKLLIARERPLAGWVLGAAWLALVVTAHRLYLTVRLRHEAA